LGEEEEEHEGVLGVLGAEESFSRSALEIWALDDFLSFDGDFGTFEGELGVAEDERLREGGF